MNDSTMEMTAWTDSAMRAAREPNQYVRRGVFVRTGDGARLVRVDGDGHHFDALYRA